VGISAPGLTDQAKLPLSARQVELADKLGSLTHLPVGTVGTCPAEWSGDGVSYSLAPNKTNLSDIEFSTDEEEIRVGFIGESGKQALRAGLGSFREGTIEIAGLSFAYGACAAWRKSNVLEITMFMTQYPLRDTIVCHFVNDSVQISSTRNVWLAPTLSDMALLPTLVGSKFRDRDTWIGITKESE